MRSRPFTARLPFPVHQMAEFRAACLGYRSVGGYVAGLIRADAILKRGHDLPLWIANLPLRAQDYIDDRLQSLPPASVATERVLTSHFRAAILAVEIAKGKTAPHAVSGMPYQLARLFQGESADNPLLAPAGGTDAVLRLADVSTGLQKEAA